MSNFVEEEAVRRDLANAMSDIEGWKVLAAKLRAQLAKCREALRMWSEGDTARADIWTITRAALASTEPQAEPAKLNDPLKFTAEEFASFFEPDDTPADVSKKAGEGSYQGLTHDVSNLTSWRTENCRRNVHAFDEAWSPSEHYLSCDACGLMVHIKSVDWSHVACGAEPAEKEGGHG